MAKFYESSPIKKVRRTKAEIEVIHEAMYSALAEDRPMTLRQVFYRLVAQGIVPKSENVYKNTVGRQLLRLRRNGVVPHDWVSDNTRWMRKPQTYTSLEQALAWTVQTYRRSVWADQNAYVEVWLEKDALAGVLMEETEPWDVPLMVSRGFSSETYLYEAAQAIRAANKPTFIYHCGDHDPSGVDITRDIEKRLRGFVPDAEIHFERIAVTEDQIFEFDLPTRPTKTTDSRSKKFKGDSVDVDAIPSITLRRMVRKAITQHIDHEVHERLMLSERLERRTLADFVRAWS